MPRPKRYPENVLVRLPSGTLSRFDALLGVGEFRADVFRQLVLREIARRMGAVGSKENDHGETQPVDDGS